MVPYGTTDWLPCIYAICHSNISLSVKCICSLASYGAEHHVAIALSICTPLYCIAVRSVSLAHVCVLGASIRIVIHVVVL